MYTVLASVCYFLAWVYNTTTLITLLICVMLVLVGGILAYFYLLKEESRNDHSTITIVSRDDFVGQYVGWSAKKTNDLLNANLGKVVFIDEAYSLVNPSSHGDSFGYEVLNTINLFLSQHPNEIIVILAGYGNLIKTRLLDPQPGLRRRFMWSFTNDGYSSLELYQIFLLQIHESGWRISKNFNLKSMFEQNIDVFRNYAGDTERLIFYSKLKQSRDAIANESVLPMTLSENHVTKGLELLKKMSHNLSG